MGKSINTAKQSKTTILEESGENRMGVEEKNRKAMLTVFKGGKKTEKAPDINPDFLSKLKQLPENIQSAFFDLPQTLQRKITKGGFERDKEKSIQNIFGLDDRSKFHYSEETIKKVAVDPETSLLELYVHNVLVRLISSLYKSTKEINIKEFMDSVWGNRGKRGGDLNFFRKQEFDKIREEIDQIYSRKTALEKQIEKLEKKKSNRIRKKVLQKLKSQYSRERYQDSLWSREATYELRGKLLKEKDEQKLQETLNYILEYMDASDFAIILSERIERDLKRWIEKEEFEEIMNGIDKWFEGNEAGMPLKGVDQAKASVRKSKKTNKLLEHFLALFASYLRRKDDQYPKAKEEMKNTAMEMEVALHILNKAFKN